jgi:hypothetical protein
VKILTDEHEMVCKIEPPRSEEEMAELDADMGEEVAPEGEEAETEVEATEGTES